MVTDVRQVIRLAPAWRSVLGEESFPDYFGRDSTLNGQVLDRVGQLLGAEVARRPGNVCGREKHPFHPFGPARPAAAPIARPARRR
jgi:hypothetical protein